MPDSTPNDGVGDVDNDVVNAVSIPGIVGDSPNDDAPLLLGKDKGKANLNSLITEMIRS
jgi:hypothetical protein